MSLRINHNIDAIVGQRNLSMNSANLSKSLQRLSSGLRINSAADNPAGLVISEQMRAQITGLGQAINNTQNAVSMVQTTEGALDEVNSLLNKARQLTLDAANTGVNDTNQLAADQAELDNVIASVTRISQVTQFGTKNLLNGTLDGASGESSGISHVRVGNLANNAAISAGVANIAVTAATKENTVFGKSGATTSTGAFSAVVTGLNIGGATVLSGVQVALTAGSGSVSITIGAGGLVLSGVASALNTALSGQSLDYTVSSSGGQLTVSRNNIGASPFASSISFTSAAITATTGTFESVTASLQGTANTSGTVAGIVFSGATALSGVTSGSNVNDGTIFNYALQTATGGSFSGSYTVTTGGQTLAAVMTSLQTAIQAHASFTGATVAMGTGSAANTLNIKLSRELTTQGTDFQFSLTVDNANNFTQQTQVNAIAVVGASFDTTGSDATFFLSGANGTALSGTAISTLTFLASGTAMELTVNGQTVAATGGITMTGVADALNAAIQAKTGLETVHVRFLTGGGAISGGFSGYNGLTGTVTTGAGFVIYNSANTALDISLSVDQLNGTNVNVADVEVHAGTVADVALDLTTTSQTRQDNVAIVAGVAASGVSSSTGGSTVNAGTNSSATMTTANGVTLNLTNTFTSSSGVNLLTLTTGTQDLGYKNFSVEITNALSLAGGNESFTLGNGAEFQIGSNGGQTVGLTIDASSASDMGRNASTTLASLEDLSSSKKGALTNGLTTEALKVIDAAINQVTNLRGSLGAFQANTLQSGLNSLQVSSQNLTAAESTIRDVDFAVESANFTRNQILVQASTSMLAQANQLPQSVLKLLG